MPPEGTLQMNALEELLDQGHTAELRQPDAIGGYTKISGSTGHCCQTTFLMRVHNKGQNSHFRGSQQAFLGFSKCP
jgi:hypothetical protein